MRLHALPNPERREGYPAAALPLLLEDPGLGGYTHGSPIILRTRFLGSYDHDRSEHGIGLSAGVRLAHVGDAAANVGAAVGWAGAPNASARAEHDRGAQTYQRQ